MVPTGRPPGKCGGMEIARIERVEGQRGFRFRVAFEDGGEVEISAAQLYSYPQFQRAALAQAGRLYRFRGDDLPPRWLRREWHFEVERLLRRSAAAPESAGLLGSRPAQGAAP